MIVHMTSSEAMTPDDPIGERLLPREQECLQSEILTLMLGSQRHYSRFPGAQPVSMDRSNLELLANKRHCHSQSILLLTMTLKVLGDIQGRWNALHVVAHEAWRVRHQQRL